MLKFCEHKALALIINDILSYKEENDKRYCREGNDLYNVNCKVCKKLFIHRIQWWCSGKGFALRANMKKTYTDLIDHLEKLESSLLDEPIPEKEKSKDDPAETTSILKKEIADKKLIVTFGEGGRGQP